MELLRTSLLLAVVPVLVLSLPYSEEGSNSKRSSGPLCFACTLSDDPGQCTRTVRCEEDEVCYVEKVTITGTTDKFNQGCTRQQVCSAFHGTGPLVGKRENSRSRSLSNMGKRVIPRCNECCNGDICNTNQCGTGATTAPPPTVPPNSTTWARLIGGSNPYEGRVELFHSGRWGTVCDDNWGGEEAAVICGMLGFGRDGAGAVPVAGFGSAPTYAHIWLDEVNCTGTETIIDQCQHNDWDKNDCTHREDAGVECSPMRTQDNFILLVDTGVGGLIFRMDIDTQSFTPIPMNPLYTPSALDYDPTDGRIYFVDPTLRQLLSVHFSGTDIRELKQLDANADLEKVAVDPINRVLFYADTGNDFIASINLDGSNFKVLANDTVDEPRDLAIDPQNRVVYWTDWGSSPKIEKMNYDGTGRQAIASTNMKWPNGLALDYTTNILYFVDASTDQIEKINTDGTGRSVVMSDPGSHMFALSLYKQYIYYTDWTSSSVMRVNKDGTGKTTVGPPSFKQLADIHVQHYGSGMPGIVTPAPIVQDETHMFVRLLGSGNHNEGLVEVYANGVWGTICDDGWTNADASVICDMMGFGKANAVAVNESRYGSDGNVLIFLDSVNCTGQESHIAQCTLPSDWGVHDCSHSEDAGVTCQLDPTTIKSFVLMADSYSSEVYRMDLETGSYSAIPNTNVYSPIAVDYDPVSHNVFYTDVRAGIIRQTSLDGATQKDLLQLNRIATPDGLVVDDTNRLLFYTDTGNDVIGKIGIDGTGQSNIITTNLNEPRAIAVDKKNQVVYWTDWGSNPKIEKANYDGSGRQVIANGTGLNLPNGLTFDEKDNKLYFCDAGTNKIEVMNTDGSSRQVLFEDSGAHFFGVDTDEEFIYFSDWTKDGVMKIEKSGVSEIPIGPPSFVRLNGVAVYKSNSG
ncbi:low-density lipoprotein receptor-related protein 4-like [Mizuhopecten yessoensis]|uniref:Low-density lipoprotein receptor-related protein 4 n=1 Tax=Mizuhopecten yessoensis TaxID=6573 RepID=A0A210QAH0_MIZYE|nr:low-density lipoprotein receptor-related protein 4-like [Mizuhopecten yessoensis]OWF45722.1 Low-density lipoprotein receptor-related protein 4 [Mizuhopecten yessoensis]